MTIWSFIQRDHPLLAREILYALDNGLDTIDPSRIGQASKRYVWQCIQAHNHALAKLLADAVFLEVKAMFGATIEIECRVVCQAIAKNLHANDKVTRGAAA